MKKIIYILSSLFLLAIKNVDAQDLVKSISCGDIVQGEFTAVDQDIYYKIAMAPGDRLQVFGSVIGDYLKYDIDIIAPSKTYVSGEYNRGSYNTVYNTIRTMAKQVARKPTALTGILSERGNYLLHLANGPASTEFGTGRMGIYILHVRCVLRDGTEIEPGSKLLPSTVKHPSTQRENNPEPSRVEIDQDPLSNAETNTQPLHQQVTEPLQQPQPKSQNVSLTTGAKETPKITTNSDSEPRSSAIEKFEGFSGVPALSLDDMELLAMEVGKTIRGKVPSSGSFIKGYTLNARAKARTVLFLERKAGNQNLGLVVLDTDRRVVFQATMNTGWRLETQIVFPESGEYTVVIYRASMLPPPIPSVTSYELRLESLY